jgi:hypothetical protein
MKFRHPFTLLLSRLALALGSAGFIVLMGMPVSPALAATPAYIRVIHASPEIGTADVFVDGSKLLSSFAFGSVTDYAALPPGSHLVQIALVGKGINAAVITQTLAVQPGFVYTAAAIGTKATGLSIEVFVDNNFIAAGQPKTRVYNLSPDAGTLTVTSGGQVLVNAVAYQQASNYLTIPAGSYTFAFSAPSTNTNLPLSQKLTKNTVTSVFVVGMVHGIPKIELIPSSVSGVPGVPGTGSDPRPLPGSEQAQSFTPWILSLLVVVLLCAGFMTWRRVFSQ